MSNTSPPLSTACTFALIEHSRSANRIEDALKAAEHIAPVTADVTQILHELSLDGDGILFEGAQGTLLDIDHGTYPFVTSSAPTAGGGEGGVGRVAVGGAGHRDRHCGDRRPRV